jgi:hypothetical protein
MGDDSTHIAQWQVKPCRLFHHTYAPVYIGRETIAEIVMDAFLPSRYGHRMTDGKPTYPNETNAKTGEQAAANVDNAESALLHLQCRYRHRAQQEALQLTPKQHCYIIAKKPAD